MRIISASIQDSILVLRSPGSMPAGSIGSPMLTVIVQGSFRKEFLPQNSPALCATGTTGTPVWVASHAPPMPYLPFFPGAMRVPSGKITIQNPYLSRSFPCSTICFSAALRELRSMAIGLVKARPQPKNGTRNSSFLRTQT